MNEKYAQSDDIEIVLSLHKNKGWELYKQDLVNRIDKLNIKKDSLLSQHKDREAGETLARQKELMLSVNWVESKLKELKEKI